jgi:SpoVK/Ycf46/Vps4 family AAA+-type ATPase
VIATRETDETAEWFDENQRSLSAAFQRIERLLNRAVDPHAQASGTDQPHEADSLPPAAIDVLMRAFRLSAFERDVLLLTAAAEIEPRIADRLGTDSGRIGFPSVGDALAALPHPHWDAFTPASPLRYWRLIEVQNDRPLLAATLRIDERILQYMLGVNGLDRRLIPLMVHAEPPLLMAREHSSIAREIARSVREGSRPYPLIQMVGDDADGQRDAASLMAVELGVELHEIRADDIPEAPIDRSTLAVLWSRESVLLDSGLLVRADANRPGKHVGSFIDTLSGGPLFVSSEVPVQVQRPYRCVEINPPAQGERERLWLMALGESEHGASDVVQGLATQFKVSARRIAAAAATAAPEDDEARRIDAARRACALEIRSRLERLAQSISTVARWDDLVLPDSTTAGLREIANQVRHRALVHEQWGFTSRGSRGLGVTALFTGESGTGKTLAAEVLAGDLGLDLYRVDLSAVISKYIGETEKNLRQIFDAADAGGVILLFDEADALFGKRSEVRDSHDRYANVEVSYLLQRMEAYDGLAILTTNNKVALDRAFHRRVRFILHFPFPDQAQRKAIWQSVFPASVPLRKVDFDRLARLNVAGGTARNIAINAAFLAAASGRAVGMPDLLAAARGELAKTEKTIPDGEARAWA